MTTLREAAIAVIERWDSPLDWRNRPSTARYMEDLRNAIEAPEQEPDIRNLQAEGKGPAPCARFCEAKAFENAIRQAESERDEMRNKYLQGVELANSFAQLTVDLTKECDEYRTAADAMAADHKVERDALILANRDLSNWFDALKIDHDALLAAGKLALEALNLSYMRSDRLIEKEYEQAIAALKEAGVK